MAAASARVAAGGRGREHAFVVVQAGAVKILGRSGCRHLLDEDVVVAAIGRTGTAEVPGWGRRTANDHDIRVGCLDGRVGLRQKLGVDGTVDQASRPFPIDVRFIPDFDGVGTEPGDRRDESGVILVVLLLVDSDFVAIAFYAEQHFEAVGARMVDDVLRIGSGAAAIPDHLHFEPGHAGRSHLVWI